MPSNKILEEKKQIVNELTDRIKNAKSGVIVSYMGLNVQEDTELKLIQTAAAFLGKQMEE